MNRKWQVAKKISDALRSRFPEMHPLVVQLLYNRGLETQTAVDEFLNPDYGQDSHDPFLFQGMERAVERIFKAVESHEPITVHGDYDADGVSATVIAVSILQALGATVNVYIPHRMSEGYGLNMKSVDELAKRGTRLIITVDCGISNKAEVQHAADQGMDVIVTDHHESPPALPAAYATINPAVGGERYPFRRLSGAGVAFKLAQAIVQRAVGRFEVKEGFEKWLLDLVAIGTIGDCVPLIGENRTLARYGLMVLRKTRRPGLLQLAAASRLNLPTVDTGGVSFGIVPRLNAAGRIDHANTAYELLMATDVAVAERVAGELEKTNQERQRVTERMLKEAKRQLGEVGEQKILFVSHEGWSAGLVGLVAGRLMDEYSRPVLVMGERQGEIVGSGRSIPGFDITAALIKSHQFLDRYGGHAAACGFTLQRDKLADFEQALTALAEQSIKPTDMVKKIFIDSEIELEQVDWKLIEEIGRFEPFGEDNKQPRFLCSGLELTDIQKVGNTGKHLRLQVSSGETSRKIIAFGFGNTWGNQLKIGDIIDAVFEVSFNEWNGNRELQLKAVDLRPA